MLTQNPSPPKILNPNLAKFTNPFIKTLTPKIHLPPQNPKPLLIQCSLRRDIRALAGRSKNPPGAGSGGRIEGSAELRREARRNAKRRARRLAENLSYRLKNPHKNHADNFSEDELQMIGLGYDRMVRFMKKDDPNLRHPYDWYKYGEFGPYSWRGVVLGEPVRGRLSDECVSMMGEVRDHEEWEEIEQFEMAQDYGNRLNSLDRELGLQYFWVFVRHPKWRVTDKPWEQWTLVCEVAIEAGKQRLDKWNLMGRLGQKTRGLITKCAAWMRPDIIYVKRPVYQSRFEPQAGFFKALVPFLDPETEQDHLVTLKGDDGGVELCTYFGGLCKLVKVNPKAFVDDVVKGFEKLSDEKKAKCLEFLLVNHPILLLHPYTKEWKVKLEEMELGCDAEDEEEAVGDDVEVTDWIEDDGGNNEDGDENEDVVIDMDGDGDDSDDVLGVGDDEEDLSDEKSKKYWEDKFKNALNSNEAMEALAKQSMEMSTKMYEKQMRKEEERQMVHPEDGDELAMRGKRAKVTPKEWKMLGYGPYRRRIRKSRIPPGLFLRAAVRPFTYKNLVKEIVLTRHAILDGEIRARD